MDSSGEFDFTFSPPTTPRQKSSIGKVRSTGSMSGPSSEESNANSDLHSTAEVSSVSGGLYEIVEYDLHDEDGTSSDMFGDLDTLKIEDDSPAAEALRANAKIRVSTMGKAARAVHMQTVRRIVKKATLREKNGVLRGKPPRLPPSQPSQEFAANQQHLHPITESEEDPSNSVPAPDDVVPGTIEAGKKVLGHLDPHDLLRLLRWRRKKKGVLKAPKSYVKGKVIDGQHELYTLSIAVMIGVRTSISRTNTELNAGATKRWIEPKDFKATEKYEFRPKGGGLTPPHQLAHTFKFKDYAPLAFAYLRRMYGVNEFDFLLSVCGNANFIEFISNAKSGQFFFYSSDGRYMIKTMTNAESKFLRRILPQYFKHCAENPNTMITRFFGMYRVKMYHLRRNVKFVVMNSVYYTDKYLQQFYDLKGSVIGRDAKPHQAVKKDNDLRRSLPEGALSLSPIVHDRVRGQITSDCDFLMKSAIMDYSMLVGIHLVPVQENTGMASMGFRGSRGRRSLTEDIAPAIAAAAASVAESEEHENASNLPVTVDIPVKSSAEPKGENTERFPTFRSQSSGRHFTDSIGAFFDGLDDDDDSYLIGSEKRKNNCQSFHEETERKKQATIEKLYWPFHRWFDIHGHRRLKPDTSYEHSEEDALLIAGYNIPDFVPPLSDRKDGGLEMDTSGFNMPMVYKGPHGEQPYRGKIFYMGIIDILQEFNVRKVIEAQYRMMNAQGKLDASCVNPRDYGQRFIDFFDEYTQRYDASASKTQTPNEEEEEEDKKEGSSEQAEQQGTVQTPPSHNPEESTEAE